MSLPLQQIESEALGLPADERARLAEALIASLDEDARLERAWDEEIALRVEDLRSGRVKGIPAEEVFAEMEDLLG
ncbi:MAG TPA: addiction module protein [Longimicrobiaceae bacterium]|nr:addiction module protein [Longimicrobiaceae bacterium]